MSKGNEKHTTNASSEIVRVILHTLLSTTLRVFIPAAVFFVAGFIIDRSCETRPWGMIVGSGIGIMVAVWLIILQLKGIRVENKKGKAKDGNKHQS